MFQKDDIEKEDFSLKQLLSSKKTFLEQGKNKSEASVLSQIRNLENVSFVNEADLLKCNSVLELQLLIDSVVPYVKSLSADEYVRQMHESYERHKYQVENMKIFNSEKDRLLGLPFQMKRHEQFPEPYIGTWQYDLYEELYGNPYDEGKKEFETEEKIHKFNYEKHLHPALLARFDKDSEEFDMFIKQMNVENKTRLEKLKENRTFFCKNILPNLNLLNDKQKGRDFAYFILNNQRNSLRLHYYNDYSGNFEERLFREAEELRLIDKNPQVVSDIQMSTVKNEYKGIRSKELKEILLNSNKRTSSENALREKYVTHNPKGLWENYKKQRNRLGLIDTIIEEGVDVNKISSGEIDYQKLHELTYDNPDPTEDEEAALSVKNGYFSQNNTLPLGLHPYNEVIYSLGVSFNDYTEKSNELSLLSAKEMRYENKQKHDEAEYLKKFSRKYSDPSKKQFEMTFEPHKQRENEEFSEKIFKRKALQTFEDRESLYKSELNTINTYINDRIIQDSSRLINDLTEDDLNQALFEASYQKPVEDTEEYKKLEKRNFSEIESLFKALKITPSELWDDPVIERNQVHRRPYTEFAQVTDPLYHLLSEVEQPEVLRSVMKEWRKGVEIRNKLPYYPDSKKVGEYDYFRMI